MTTDLSPAPEDELPIPNPPRIREWWAAQASQFSADERYIRGQPMTPPTVAAARVEGPLRRAPLLAYEVAIRTAGQVQLPPLRLAYGKPTLPANLSLRR